MQKDVTQVGEFWKSERARMRLTDANCIVVKIGSALLADTSLRPFQRFAQQLAHVRGLGKRVVLVSSGAIALGLKPMRLDSRPKELALLQAAAAAGQSRLMSRWSDACESLQIDVAQILLTHADLKDRRRYLNARSALMRLLDASVLPIINENDTVAVDEIKVGDNDNLAAAICGLVDADAVVLLTSAEGFFTADPHVDKTALRIPYVDDITADIKSMAGGAAAHGTGGMVTKIEAAHTAHLHGACTVVAPGRVDDVLPRLFGGEDIGTLFAAPEGGHEGKQRARKRWIATAHRTSGRLVVDAGARAAITKGGSLLLAGVRDVVGGFDARDVVDIVDLDGAIFARGIVQIDATSARAYAGKRSSDILAVWADAPDEAMHRDDLLVLEDGADGAR
jgi:glutamate 5-kinase